MSIFGRTQANTRMMAWCQSFHDLQLTTLSVARLKIRTQPSWTKCRHHHSVLLMLKMKNTLTFLCQNVLYLEIRGTCRFCNNSCSVNIVSSLPLWLEIIGLHHSMLIYIVSSFPSEPIFIAQCRINQYSMLTILYRNCICLNSTQRYIIYHVLHSYQHN